MGDGKLPAMQFYPGDWRRDLGVKALKFDERMIWFEIVLLMHDSPKRGVLLLPNGKPMPVREIAKQLGCSTGRIERALVNIKDLGVCSQDAETGAITNRRMLRDEAIRQARIEGGKAGKEHGHKGAEHGIKGGRPPALMGLEKPPLKPPSAEPEKPPPSSSSSSSSSGESPSFERVPSRNGDSPTPPPSGRTNERTEPEDYQRFWGPVEGRLRVNMTPERFELFEGIRVVDFGAEKVILAVQSDLIEREGNATATAQLLQSLAGDDFTRGRTVEVISLAEFIGRSIPGARR